MNLSIQKDVPAALTILALVLTGCSEKPTAPEPTPTLSGHLEFVGHLAGADGTVTGERVIDDADGVPVYLVAGGIVIDSTRSTDGGFHFRVTQGMTYLAFVRATPSVADTTGPFTIAAADAAFPDPIRLLSTSSLSTAPNPFRSETTLRFSLPVDGEVQVKAWSLFGSPMRSLLSGNQAAGVHQVTWDGAVDGGSTAPPGAYWVGLDTPTGHAAELVFYEGVGISGPVQLIATTYDEIGRVTGLRAVRDAVGFRVRLHRPDGGIDSTETVGGRYEFGVSAAGTYRASVRVVPDVEISTENLTVSGASVSAETLTVAQRGQLTTGPNPLTDNHGVAIQFELSNSEAGHTVVAVLDIHGNTVWSYAYDAYAGVNHIHWPGTFSDNTTQTPNGNYWIVVSTVLEDRYGVLIRE